jgi:hypothetical protein
MNDKRSVLLDRIGRNFYQLEQKLGNGLQVLLELESVSPSTRQAVGEYMRDVLKGVATLETDVEKLAGVTRERILDPKEHGHENLSGLAQEVRQDEEYAKMLGEKAGVDRDRGMER